MSVSYLVRRTAFPLNFALLTLLSFLLPTHAITPDLAPFSLPLTKQLTPPLHRHRAGHHEPRRARAFGSLFATYLATVEIDDAPFTCILDTGSSDFAVAASADCGCSVYYAGDCDASPSAPHLDVRYGDGNWTGLACTDEVSINGMSLGEVTFAGMKRQSSMLECDALHQQNGIIGLAFPGLLGPPANYTLPFFDLLTAHTHLPAVFALQCCGWQNDSSQEYNAEYAQGALDLGGVNRKHVRGDVYYTPITERLFYAVDLVDIRVDGVSTMPVYRRPASAQYRRRRRRADAHRHSDDDGPREEDTEEGQGENAGLRWAELPFPPQSIVDSGTSNLVFTPDIFNLTVAQLQRLVPAQPDAVWDGEECIHHSPDGSDVTATWPILTLVLGGEGSEPPFALDIPPCRYLAKAPAKECKDGVAGHAFAIESNDNEGVILGQVVYESFYVVHDNERNRVGFGKLGGCQSDVDCLKAVKVRTDDVLVRAKVVRAVDVAVVEVAERGRAEGESVGVWRWTWLMAMVGLLLLVGVWLGWRQVMRKGRHEYDIIGGDSGDDLDLVYTHH